MATMAIISGGDSNLRVLHGRGMNVTSNIYKLPADPEEMERLSDQHRRWKVLVGGLYPEEIKELVSKVLEPQNGRQPAILDVGSGSGSWVSEMAEEFPHTRVLGMDLADGRPEVIPANCSFVRQDATKCLHEYAGQFDLVHCRNVVGHIVDGYSFVELLGRALRPGGLLLIGDGNLNVYNEEDERIPPANPDGSDNEGRSWVALYLLETINRMDARKHSTGITDANVLYKAICENKLFKNTELRPYRFPIGWDGGGKIKNGPELSALELKIMKRSVLSAKPLLLSTGLSEETVDIWARNAIAEGEDKNSRIVGKWHMVWATRS